MYEFSVYLLCFMVYSFLGWLYELIYYLIAFRKPMKPNFLRLPISPIYGIGALAIILLVAPYAHNPAVVFLGSVLVATLLEYVSYVFLEKVFHIELWDYSNKRFHFQGKVALDAAIAFGLLALLLVYVIHPLVSVYVGSWPQVVTITIALFAGAVILIDFLNTVATLTRIRLSTITGTFAELVESFGVVSDQEVKQQRRLRRTRLALSKVHRANVRRLHRVYPRAHVTPRPAKRR